MQAFSQLMEIQRQNTMKSQAVVEMPRQTTLIELEVQLGQEAERLASLKSKRKSGRPSKEDAEYFRLMRGKKIALNRIKAANAICNYEYKLSLLVDFMDKLMDTTGLDSFGMTSRATAVVRVIAELNKMQGHYAPEKHMIMNVNLSKEQSDKIQSLIEKCEKEF
jgi:hypothetical protein